MTGFHWPGRPAVLVGLAACGSSPGPCTIRSDRALEEGLLFVTPGPLDAALHPDRYPDTVGAWRVGFRPAGAGRFEVQLAAGAQPPPTAGWLAVDGAGPLRIWPRSPRGPLPWE